MKHYAYILYNTRNDMKYKTKDISGSDGEFKDGDTTYKKRESASFLFKRTKWVTKFWTIPIPTKDWERRSYYEAGISEPITWERPEANPEGIAFWAEDLYNAKVEQTGWADLFKIGGGRGGILGYLLIGGAIVGGIVFILFILPMITGSGLMPGT